MSERLLKNLTLAAVLALLALTPASTRADEVPATQPTTQPATQPADAVDEADAPADDPAEADDTDEPTAPKADRPARRTIGTALDTGLVDQSNVFKQAIDYAQKRTVKIFGGGIGREHGYASGIIVSDDGAILCAHGIYASSPRLRVVTPDGKEHIATVVRRNDDLQLLLLKLDAATPDFFTLDPEVRPVRGDWVVGISNVFAVAHFEEKMSANLGIVSMRSELDAKRRAADISYNGEALLIDAITSNPGSPGGALMTADGHLAGMIGKNLQSKATNTWINYAVPVDLLDAFMKGKIIESRDDVAAAKPYLGLSVFSVSRNAPAYVHRVKPDSPAEEGGLRPDDLILAIEDETIMDVRDYNKVFPTLRPEEKVKFVIKRRDQILSIFVTPIAEPEESDE